MFFAGHCFGFVFYPVLFGAFLTDVAVAPIRFLSDKYFPILFGYIPSFLFPGMKVRDTDGYDGGDFVYTAEVPPLHGQNP